MKKIGAMIIALLLGLVVGVHGASQEVTSAKIVGTPTTLPPDQAAR